MKIITASRTATAVLYGVLRAAWAGVGRAQDVEPRLLTPAPVGTDLFGITVSSSWGAVLLDKTLPVDDVDGVTFSLVPSYSRYVGIFGRTARVDAVVPIANGEWDFVLGDSGVEGTTTREGFGDPRIALTFFVSGARAVDWSQFREYRRKTIIGFSIRVSMPLGQYDATKLLNLGSNRWQLVSGAVAAHRMGRWTAEFYAGLWLFTENREFLGDNVLAQDPKVAFQLNLSYDFKPGMWLSLGTRQTAAGRTTLNGVKKDDPTENNRVGLVFGVPIVRRQTIKLIATTGTTATKGSDFNTVVVQWFYSW